jgi:death-on-curing protein
VDDEIVFLTVDEVLDLHRQQVEAFGGAIDVRDLGLLQSAVAMPATGFGGAFAHEFPHEMAAAYLFHIAANHPFVDGNKRTALAAALTFLEENGFRLDADQQSVGDLVLDLASGEIDKAVVADFFKRHARVSDDA